MKYVYLVDSKLVAYYLIQRGGSVTDIFTKIASLLRVLKKKGDVYIAFDIGTSDYRLGEQSYYKGHRRKATKKLSVADQIKHEKFNEDYIKLMELFRLTSARVLGVQGVEADDLISIVNERIKEGNRVTLITGDYDYLHLVVGTNNVRLYDFPKDDIVKHDDIIEKYNVDSRRKFSVLKSIVGDKSDNIKFVRNMAEVKGTKVFNESYDKHDEPTDDDIIAEIEAVLEEHPRMELYEHHIEAGRTTAREAFLSNMKIADPFIDTSKMTKVQIEAFNECLSYPIDKNGITTAAFMSKAVELYGYPIILDDFTRKVYNLT